MTPKKKICLVVLAALDLISLSYADSSLSYLSSTQTEVVPQVCGYNDLQWYQKSGPDSVSISKVESQTLFLQADNINGQMKGINVADGNVLAYKESQTMVSDWAIYDQSKDQVTLGDHLVLTRQFDAIQGKWADYYLDLNKGTFTQATMYYNKDNITATGTQIDVLDKTHMNVQNGTFTSCNPIDPAWYIKADQMKFDYQDSQGTARNPVMYFESIPIFASPYMTFPLGQRRSGFLTPTFGGSSTAGTMFSEPYYWNMAPNYDMTITPEFWTEQGFMVTDKFRYLTDSNIGSIYTEQLAIPTNTSEPGIPSYRWYWSLDDVYKPIKDVTMGYNYNQVSDGNYFNDFGNFYSVTDNVNLNQSIYANYKPTWGLASVKLQNYQTLFPYGTTQTVSIYSQYPQVNFNVNPQDLGGGVKGGLTSQYTDFYSPSMQSGQREVFYPSLTYPMQSAWGFVTPKVGYNITQYQLGTNPGYPGSNGDYQISLPITSIDSGLYFDRPLSYTSGGAYTQTFEPRLYYLYIPEQNQSQLPLFDTATATFNYSQLFSENRFSGMDRVNSANDITIGGTTRFINDTNGAELMNLSLGYRYFITPQNDFLYGNQTQDGQLFLPAPNLITELNNNWSKTISTRATFQYDTTYSNIDAYTANVKWNPDDGKVINLGFNYQYNLPLLFYAYTPGQAFTPTSYENQYAVTVSEQWPIYENKIYAISSANYDFTRQMLLNVVGGAQYNGGCYTVSAVYQQYVFNYNQTQSVWMLNFNFKGIGDIGSGDPSSALNLNVPGYMPISQIQKNQVQ